MLLISTGLAIQIISLQGSTISSSPSHPSVGNSANIGITNVPVLIGWGGIRLDEAAVGGGVNHPVTPVPSAVLVGESATNMELAMIKMKARGYNTVRVDFDPYCTASQSLSAYNATNLQRAIQIAQFYGFWIVIDYHGFSEPFNSSQESCWLNFWSGVTSQFKNSYNEIIWEPLNEPCYSSTCAGNITLNDMCTGASSCVSVLSRDYQQWISQARAQGDTHWIVVQNICSYGCSLSDWAIGFPTVTDPLGTLSQGGRIFISLHSYMGYSSDSWDNTAAESMAQRYYQAVVAGMEATGWPALNTEGGADPLCTSCAPDTVLTGSSGYTNTTFHFIQKLTNLYDSNSPERINWIWWPAGSWTNTPGSGIYGALQCDSKPVGWGCALKATPISSGTPTVAPPQSARPSYMLTWLGYDWDGGQEETLTLNGQILAALPSANSPQNQGVNTSFALNITSVLALGVNILDITHANWDCSVIDSVSDLQVAWTVGNQSIVVYSNPSALALDCGQQVTVQFTTLRPTYSLTLLGFDWDGTQEETLTLNGHPLATLPSVTSPQNGQSFTAFSLGITSFVQPGVNTLIITHANWDCAVVDTVENLQINLYFGNRTIAVYNNPGPGPLGCGHPVTYIFTVPVFQ